MYEPSPTKRDDLAVGQRHLRSPRAGDLVAHAREPVLAVEVVERLGAPAVVELAGEPARRSRARSRSAWRVRSIAPTTCAYVGQPAPRRRRSAILSMYAWYAAVSRAARSDQSSVSASRRRSVVQLAQALAGVGDDRRCERCLTASKTGGVDADERGVGGERRPRAGREVLQAGADGEDDIGGAGQLVGATCNR